MQANKQSKYIVIHVSKKSENIYPKINLFFVSINIYIYNACNVSVKENNEM